MFLCRCLPGAVAAGLLLLCAGCQPGPDTLAPVHGKVRHQGVPLPGGTIVFTPDPERGGTGPLARAEIQPDGSYILRTGEHLGAAGGWHRVTVLAVRALAPGLEGEPGQAPPSLVPQRYRDPELSGLEYEVKPNRENTADFNLD